MAQVQRKQSASKSGRGSRRTASRPASKKTAARRSRHVDNATAAREAAVAGTQAAGKAVIAAARRARVPLVIGGAATVGLAAVRARTGRSSKQFGNRLPLPLRDGKLDMEAVESAAKRVSVLTSQIGEIAGAMRRGAT